MGATLIGLLIAAVAWQFAGRPASLAEPTTHRRLKVGDNEAVVLMSSSPAARANDESRIAQDEEPSSLIVESSWAKELRELRALAAAAPAAAISRVALYADKHERKTAAKAVCLVVAEKDPAMAMTSAWQFGLGRYTDEASENLALENLAERWAHADLPQALAWANSLPADDESRRDRVWKGIASEVGKEFPDIAAQLVNETVTPDTRVRADATIEILRRWAAKDYPNASTWASQLPDAATRDRGIDELAAISDRAANSEK